MRLPTKEQIQIVAAAAARRKKERPPQVPQVKTTSYKILSGLLSYKRDVLYIGATPIKERVRLSLFFGQYCYSTEKGLRDAG